MLDILTFIIEWIGKLPIFNKLKAHQKRQLSNLTFYKNLLPKEKRKFEYRVSRFIKEHHFVGRKEFKITSSVQLGIASIAIMLTFRLKKYLFNHFENIIVYPKDYFSLHTGAIHKGETNPRAKTIVFSWEGFVEGIKIENDNLNLGIHEFSHALFFSFFKQTNSEARNFIKQCKEVFLFLTDAKKKHKVVSSNYLREYAFVNQHEFLAVITENYFETPNEFQKKLPALFSAVNKLYKIY